MNHDIQIQKSDDATRRPAPGIALLLFVIFLIRLPFWPGVKALRDGIAYSIGALVTHVAHPPGSVGYCVLGGWLNHLVGNVETTFIDINLVAGLLGTYFCYRLAKTAGLMERGALLAAATYGLSLNTLTAALTIAPHLVEGVGAILAAWLGLLAMQRKHRGYALACTLTVALIGSFRPTATVFLTALWLVSIYESEAGPIRRKFGMWLIHATLFIAICASWNLANDHYMTRAGYGGTTYEKQVLTIAPYDYVSMSTDVKSSGSHHTFHLPAAEMLAWLEPQLHVRLLPHIPDWPTPSLSRAIKLSVQQAIKQATYLVVSTPVVIVVALIWLLERITRRRRLAWDALDRKTWMLLICWITPAALFFIFGHLGTLTYLQNYLGGVSVACVALLSPRRDMFQNQKPKPNSSLDKSDETEPADFAAESGNPKPNSLLTFWPATLCAAAGGLVFAFGHPLATSNSKLNLLNVCVLQYTGPSKAAGYGASRILSVHNADTAAVKTDQDYENVHGDRELIEAAWRNHFEYLNPDPNAKPTGPSD